MKRFALITIAAAFVSVAAYAQTGEEYNDDNAVTYDLPQTNDYTGGVKIQYNAPLSTADDPYVWYNGANVRGPAADPDNQVLSQSAQDLIDSVDEIVDDDPPVL